MKKLISFILLLVFCQTADAGDSNRNVARQKATNFLGRTTSLKLVAEDPGDKPAYYIFNAEQGREGFVIVSGDDTDNCILGYSDTGEFNPDDVPPALKYWLECYSEQVAQIRQGRAKAHTRAVANEDIEPLIKTQWDQNSPYSGGNPVNPLTGKPFEYAGCVATVLAQILRYWAAPLTTQAIPSYNYYLSPDGSTSNRKEIVGYSVVTVPELPATDFDYTVMQNTYDVGAEGTSIDETARLIAYCGRAVQTAYDEVSGSAAIPSGVFSYFGFKSVGETKSRADYSAEAWDELIYKELKAGRPVVYRGSALSDLGQSGHAFICDGYRDGLYHINWGWNGRYNGFFKLSEANPDGTGSGGANGVNGYSISQSALIGIQPDVLEDSEPVNTFPKTEPINQLKINKVTVDGLLKKLKKVTLHVDITNLGTITSSEVYLFIDGELNAGVGVNVDPGDSDEVPIHFIAPKAGTLQLSLYGEVDSKRNPVGEALWAESLSIGELRDPNLTCTDLVVLDAETIDNQNKVSADRLNMKFTFFNNDTEPFEDELVFRLFKMRDDGSRIGDETDSKTIQLSIPVGESREVEVCFDHLIVSSNYWVTAYGYFDSAGKYGKIHQTYAYYIQEASGINAPAYNGTSNNQTCPVFNINGQRVYQPKKGIFIRNGRKYVKKQD